MNFARADRVTVKKHSYAVHLLSVSRVKQKRFCFCESRCTSFCSVVFLFLSLVQDRCTPPSLRLLSCLFILFTHYIYTKDQKVGHNRLIAKNESKQCF